MMIKPRIISQTILVIMIFFGSGITAQDINDLFNKKSLVYYGFDFSNAVLVGNFGNGSPADLRDKMYPQWNELICAEKSKFNVRQAFRKSELHYDIVPVTQQNARTVDRKIFAEAPPSPFTVEQIQTMVAAYSGGEKKEGTAVVFIVESLDKNREKAFVYATVFDIATRQVLLTQLLKGTPAGIGLRNYWGNAFHSVIEQINNLKYGEWKKKYRTRKN